MARGDDVTALRLYDAVLAPPQGAELVWQAQAGPHALRRTGQPAGRASAEAALAASIRAGRLFRAGRSWAT
jgi:hypothetical protein